MDKRYVITCKINEGHSPIQIYYRTEDWWPLNWDQATMYWDLTIAKFTREALQHTTSKTLEVVEIP